MPSGRTHTLASTVLAAGLSTTYVYWGEQSLWAGLGCALGSVIGPDLDVDNGSMSMYIVRNLLGRPAGFVWRWFWYPYAKIMPHRSFFSHFPVVSTSLRLIYLLLLPALAAWWFGWGIEYHSWMLPVFVGLCVSDTAHAIMDAISTLVKRKTNE